MRRGRWVFYATSATIVVLVATLYIRPIRRVVVFLCADVYFKLTESRWRNYPKNSPVSDIIYRNDLPDFRRWIDSKPNLNELDKISLVPLIVAVEQGRNEMAQLLIKSGAKLNVIEFLELRTPLYIAIEKNNSEISELLLQNGANPNSRTSKKYTPLMISVEKKNFSIMKRLLELGADVNATDIYGETALMRAIRIKDMHILSLLLEHGADTKGINFEKRNVLHIAALNGCVECVKIFLKKGISANAQDKFGETPLILATQESEKYIVRLLICSGAEKSLTNNKGKSAIAYAKSDEIRKELQ